MKKFKSITKKIFRYKKTLIVLLIFILGSLLYQVIFPQGVIGPIAERDAHIKLEITKQNFLLSEFKSDGCSGRASTNWSAAVSELSERFPGFAERYKNTKDIPFETACVEHDRAYHTGIGGYVARLEADNNLRDAILNYGINNTEEIKKRTGLSSDEEVLFLYEVIASSFYNSVRVGGVPCSGMSYAWGYGYNNGSCE